MNEELLNERKTLLTNAYRMKHTERTPFVANVMTWPIFDQGYLLNQAAYDNKLMGEIFKNFAKKYDFDSYEDYATIGVLGVARALGMSNFNMSEDGEHYSVKDHHFMEENEYQLLAENFDKYNWEYAFKRHCDGELTVKKFYKAIEAFMNFGGHVENIKEFLVNECNCPLNTDNYLGFPVEQFLNYYRGLKGFSLDMRRHKEELKETLDILAETLIQPGIDAMDNIGPYDIQNVYTAVLAHTFMNSKQFEELYWPYLKRVIDACVAKDALCCIYLEGKATPIIDFLQEIPKGHVNILFEMDEPFELRKKLQNVCLTGGMSTELLAYSTEKECVDYAKKLIDGMGDGFILSQSKCLTYRNDAKSENLLAVNNFVREYKH